MCEGVPVHCTDLNYLQKFLLLLLGVQRNPCELATTSNTSFYTLFVIPMPSCYTLADHVGRANAEGQSAKCKFCCGHPVNGTVGEIFDVDKNYVQ